MPSSIIVKKGFSNPLSLANTQADESSMSVCVKRPIRSSDASFYTYAFRDIIWRHQPGLVSHAGGRPHTCPFSSLQPTTLPCK